MRAYEVYYRGELIAKVLDFEKGFIEHVYDLNAECDVFEIPADLLAGLSVNQQVETGSGTYTGVKIDRLG